MSIRMSKTVLIVMLLLIAPGCAAFHSIQSQGPVSSSFQTLISDRLYFGRSIPSGGFVSDSDWDKFLSEIVTPRFPNGLSVWQAQGQWRGKDSIIQKENSFILDLLHPDDITSEQSVQEIMTYYKLQFKQEAVLRVRDSVGVQFW